MSMTREKLERQRKLAEEQLASWTKSLESEGVTPDERVLEPRWRGLRARCQSLSRRLRAVEALAARDAEAQQRKEAGVGASEGE